MTNHPNATAATVAGGVVVLIAWALGHFNVAISAEAGAAIATVTTGIILFIGRNGIRGALQTVWSGKPKPKPTTSKEK